MAGDFEHFQEIIQQAKQEGNLSKEVQLLLAGQIEWAARRGDITLTEARELDNLMDGCLRKEYRREYRISTLGTDRLETVTT